MLLLNTMKNNMYGALHVVSVEFWPGNFAIKRATCNFLSSEWVTFKCTGTSKQHNLLVMMSVAVVSDDYEGSTWVQIIQAMSYIPFYLFSYFAMSLSTVLIKAHVRLLQFLKWPCHSSFFRRALPCDVMMIYPYFSFWYWAGSISVFFLNFGQVPVIIFYCDRYDGSNLFFFLICSRHE